ncbi:MAG: malate dehydrogenase [Candidatus Magnetoovum sp. WYHC-5]|nr:malate dehydrogenase [Candidatus Magnetoovum sp. WYHC-5]
MKMKISIIGAGHVGATVAQLLAIDGFADVVLLDIAEGVAKGKALDIMSACPLWNSSAKVVGTSDYVQINSSDIVVITAGYPRKPGMSRDDLLFKNAEIVEQSSKEIAKHSPDAIVIVVTNPMDSMTALAWKATGFNHQRIMGMGGVLDSTRFRTFIAVELGVTPEAVEALVLGGHGDLMVPLPRLTTVRGIPITNLITKEGIDALVKRTQNGGAEIVSLLGSGSAFYAPGASVCQMVRSIVFNERNVLPVSCYLDGLYGAKDIYIGVPAVLTKSGIDRIIELELLDEERSALHKSIESVRSACKKLNIF